MTEYVRIVHRMDAKEDLDLDTKKKRNWAKIIWSYDQEIGWYDERNKRFEYGYAVDWLN